MKNHQAEIELKIMLEQQNVPLIENWLNSTTQFSLLSYQCDDLGNTYYDTPEQFFAKQKMGLRVRTQNHQFEMTLKTKGEIRDGLHIRPEYNLALDHHQPDFKALVAAFQLDFDNMEQIASSLQATFSTDFHRKTWLFSVGESHIEVALDQGMIKNSYGEEVICEIEFEIKDGSISDLFRFVEALPKYDGMWFSNLSKAHRGYLVGQAVKFEQEIAKAMLADNSEKLEQQLADFIRVASENSTVLQRFSQCVGLSFSNWSQAQSFVKGKEYLIKNLNNVKNKL